MTNLTIKVTGTMHDNRQGKLWNLRKNEKNAFVKLTRDKKNPHDPNAIKVIACVKGQRPFQIGFVPAVQAKEIAPVLDNGTTKVYVKGFATKVYKAENKKCVGCDIDVKLYPAVA